MMTNALSAVKQAIADMRQGKMVILVDDAARENEGDLIIGAEKITPEAINFMSQYGRGLICLPMLPEDFERLQIPPMVKNNRAHFNTAFGVSIGAAKGITTGISAADRARTVQVAVNNQSQAQDIVMPGHIFPLQAQQGGVLARMGHTEGSIDLARLSGLKPAAVICEIMNADGSMARADDLQAFAKQHNLTICPIKDLLTYRVQHELLIKEEASTRLPLQNLGNFRSKVFSNSIDGSEHIALIAGDIKADEPCLVRLHSECLTGDVFGSMRCDCGWQLEQSLQKISVVGGVLLYMRQEGRGIGLVNKIKAYALQEQGLDTVQANQHLGFAADERDYWIAAQILRNLKVANVRLLTNNPDKISALQLYGINVVSREAIQVKPSEKNIHYLRTKQKKMGHLLKFDNDEVKTQ